MTSNRVAIVGAGPAGLLAAKYAKENGLSPIVFEKTNSIGGLWSLNSTPIWDGLYSDISFYSETFTDFPWPQNTNMFPSAEEIKQYLNAYADHFALRPIIKLNHKVDKVKQNDAKKWELNITNLETSTKTTEIFDFIILASGQHTKPRLPTIENSSSFSGILIHSSSYKTKDPKLKDKNVVVVGCSLSGAQIASALVGHAKRVVNIYPRKYFIANKLFKFKRADSTWGILPLDLLFSKRIIAHSPHQGPASEAARIAIFKGLFPEQTQPALCHPELYIDLEEPNQEILVTVSDSYMPLVKQNKLIPKRAVIKRFDGNDLVFEDGSVEENVDAVIFCTGYDKNYEHLDESVLRSFSYDTETNYKYSIILYKCTFAPDSDNLAVVGQHDGLFFTGCELQAKWVSMVFSGKLSPPEKTKMREFIQAELNKRSTGRRMQLPYGNVVTLGDSIAGEMDLLPDFDELKEKEPRLYEMFYVNSVVPAHFTFKKDREAAMSMMNDIDVMNKRVYDLGEGVDVTAKDLALEFSKFYNIPDVLLEV
jgi:dimethylaniline monooxygenase (N-oxide forming)